MRHEHERNKIWDPKESSQRSPCINRKINGTRVIHLHQGGWVSFQGVFRANHYGCVGRGRDLCAHVCVTRRVLCPAGSCRVCTVKANGRTVASCTQPVEPDMDIEHETEEILKYRKDLVRMLFHEGGIICAPFARRVAVVSCRRQPIGSASLRLPSTLICSRCALWMLLIRTSFSTITAAFSVGDVFALPGILMANTRLNGEGRGIHSASA